MAFCLGSVSSESIGYGADHGSSEKPTLLTENISLNFSKAEFALVSAGGPISLPYIKNFKKAVTFQVKMSAHLLALRLAHEKWKQENLIDPDFKKDRKAHDKTMIYIDGCEKDLANSLAQLAEQAAEVDKIKADTTKAVKAAQKTGAEKAKKRVEDTRKKAAQKERIMKGMIVDFTVSATQLEKYVKSLEKRLGK